MKSKIDIDLCRISERIDNLIDLLDDEKLIDEYPTSAILNLVETDFHEITKVLESLPGIDIHGGSLP